MSQLLGPTQRAADGRRREDAFQRCSASWYRDPLTGCACVLLTPTLLAALPLHGTQLWVPRKSGSAGPGAPLSSHGAIRFSARDSAHSPISARDSPVPLNVGLRRMAVAPCQGNGDRAWARALAASVGHIYGEGAQATLAASEPEGARCVAQPPALAQQTYQSCQSIRMEMQRRLDEPVEFHHRARGEWGSPGRTAAGSWRA